MDLSMLQGEEILGGIVAILVTIYGVHKKLRSDAVETVNQKAEVNIIEQLIKQRDDAISLSDKYRERAILNENEMRDIKIKLDAIEFDRIRLLERLDEAEADSDVLRNIIEYLTGTIQITRETIETNTSSPPSSNNDDQLDHPIDTVND